MFKLQVYTSTFYKILSASRGLQTLLSGYFFFSFKISSHFVRDFQFPWFLPSIRADLALSFSSFFSSSVFYYWVPPSWVRHPYHHLRHPIQAQAALKVLEKYWSCICVFLNFPRPLYPLTSRRSVDVEANKKPSQLGGWKNYTAFSSHSSRANWRGNVSIVPFHYPLFEGLRAMKWRWKWFVAIGKPQIIMLCGHLWDRRLFVWTNKSLLTVVTS